MKTISKHPLILGSLMLTVSGVLSRILGFLYRIFLSQTIGAEGLGLFQLVMPILMLCITVSCLGFQTAISRFVATAYPSSPQLARKYLLGGIILSVALASILSFSLYFGANSIACHFICEEKCIVLIRLISFSLIPASIHACINGYYYGIQKTFVPALSQIFEQIGRVGSVFLIYKILASKGLCLSVNHTIIGVIISEFVAVAFCLSALSFEKNVDFSLKDYFPSLSVLRDISKMVIPISLNYLMLNLCSSYENVILPQKLRLYGCSTSEALSIFGVLTGLAIPIILFPGIITNSVSVLLMPQISSSITSENKSHLFNKIKKVSLFGLLFGIFVTICFLIFGKFIGVRIFHSPIAVDLIKRLSFLCPFIYITSLLGSVIHGLGHPKYVLFTNLLASSIRIFLIFELVPAYGINAYLWGLLISYVFVTISYLYCICKNV